MATRSPFGEYFTMPLVCEMKSEKFIFKFKLIKKAFNF